MGSRLKKKLLRSSAFHAVVCWTIAVYIRLVKVTTRWKIVNSEEIRDLQARRVPFLLAFWHGRLLLLPSHWESDVPIYGLISTHRDGRLIASVMERLGVRAVEGSSTRGGTEALRGIVRILREGGCIAVAPDGPRGPRMRVGGRVLDVARLTGVPIVPVAYSTKRRWILSSWDRFLLPSPFNRGVIICAPSLRVTKDAGEGEVEEARLELERRLTEATNEADRGCGHPEIEPAAPLRP